MLKEFEDDTLLCYHDKTCVTSKRELLDQEI